MFDFVHPGQFLTPDPRGEMVTTSASIPSSSSTHNLLDGPSDTSSPSTIPPSLLTKLLDHLPFQRQKSHVSHTTTPEQVPTDANSSKPPTPNTSKYYSGPNTPSEFESLAQAHHAKREAKRHELERQRQLAKEQARQYRKDRQAKKRDEKALRHRMGGLAWGYDPVAGIMLGEGGEQGLVDAKGKGKVGSDATSPVESDGSAEPTEKFIERGTTWGIEQGGPGREGKFEHGKLSGKQAMLEYQVKRI